MPVTVSTGLASALFPPGTPAIASYRMTLIQGGAVVHTEDLPAPTDGSTKLTFSAANVPAGDYVCQVQALSAEGMGIGQPDASSVSVPVEMVSMLVPNVVTAEVTQ